MDESRKQRDKFEKWWDDEGWDKKLSNVQGVMFNRIKVGMFTAWQASRAAIEIKLDDKVMVEDEFDKGHNCAIDYCAEAIRAAGIKVKE